LDGGPAAGRIGFKKLSPQICTFNFAIPPSTNWSYQEYHTRHQAVLTALSKPRAVLLGKISEYQAPPDKDYNPLL
jgi:hypothetical protein